MMDFLFAGCVIAVRSCLMQDKHSIEAYRLKDISNLMSYY